MGTLPVLTDADRHAYRQILETCARVPTRPPAVLVFRGADAMAWLQGQVSNDLRGMDSGDVREACFLAPTGHLLAMVALARHKEYVLATVPNESAGFVRELVERTVFLEDVMLESPTWELTMLQGPVSGDRLRDAGYPGEPPEPGCAYRLSYPLETWLFWHQPESAVAARLRESVPLATSAAARAVRLELGIPIWGVDASERTLLPELGPDFVARHVSYAKGCYTGQEVLMRIRSRGHTNRTWVALLCESEVSPGDTVRSETRESAGAVTSTAESPEFGPMAAALLANDSAHPGTQVFVRSSDNEVEAVVRPFPLRG